MLCPVEDICKNKDVKCDLCIVTNKDLANLKLTKLNFKELYYEPIIKGKQYEKKVIIKIFKELYKHALKDNYTKKALKTEKKVIKNLGGKSTVNSGAKFGDGDGYIEINDCRYYIEHKTRFNNRNLFGLTKAEYQKAKSQNQDIFIVTDNNTNKSIVSMDLKTFTDILEYL